MIKQTNSIELFSGAGGLAKGLELAGARHIAFVEWNAEACKTLRKNYTPGIVHEGDIREFNFKDYGGVDIVAGGPPCQPFSLGGKARGNDDERDMFPYAVSAIRHLMPKAFIFENVKGLLRKSFAEYFQYILLQLRYPEVTSDKENWRESYDIIKRIAGGKGDKGLSYDIHCRLVNAADYGVPQKRERVIIVGFRSDLGVNWKFPEPTHSEDSLLWQKYVTGEYWQKHVTGELDVDEKQAKRLRARLLERYGMLAPELSPWRTVRDALATLHPVAGQPASDFLCRNGAREYPGHTGSLFDEPSKTIKAGAHGVPGGENMIKFNDGSVRYFTVAEAKRIQTFPDEYNIVGAWSEAMRQLGNAVPVELARVVASSVISHIANRF
ncbi:MAG TPA: DNA (cytosine-5-)-methyltransferase [Prevotellaceae bacterium]|nr:DNA (cytosine-5-)-methyltransferase [Prevotellaceae bacterium]